MKVSDYIAGYIANLGIRHVFTLPGGFSMHLNDSIAHHADLTPVYMLHEAGASIAAEAYAKLRGIGAFVVTAGPGCVNALPGVASAWLDNTPLLAISGDVRTQHYTTRNNLSLRQGGPQDIDIMRVVDGVTNYARTAIDSSCIEREMSTARNNATHPRRGPAWINIPLNVQAQEIDTEPNAPQLTNRFYRFYCDKARYVFELLKESSRPLVLFGAGALDARDEAAAMIDMLGVPVMTTWPATDLIDFGHPLFVGRPGVVAGRGVNFALQNCDLLITIGARLDIASVGFDYEQYAPNAQIVMCDIDEGEIAKVGKRVTLPVCADAGAFMRDILAHVGQQDCAEWVARCKAWKARYPFSGNSMTYCVIQDMSDLSTPDDVFVVSPSCMAGAVFFAGFRQKRGQRIISSHGLGTMGWAIPASIGAALATGKRVTVIEGDGSFMQNTQELEVIRRLDLPIRIFVFNNSGYASIRNSQSRAFNRASGADTSSGNSFVRARQLAQVYNIPIIMGSAYRHAITTQDGPIVCEIDVPLREQLEPRVESRQSPDGNWQSGRLDDMYPYLSAEERAENMTCQT